MNSLDLLVLAFALIPTPIAGAKLYVLARRWGRRYGPLTGGLISFDCVLFGLILSDLLGRTGF